MTVLGIDIDGCLAEQNKPVAAYIRRTHGIDFTVDDIDGRNPDIPEIESDYVTELKAARQEADHLQSMDALPGAVDAVQQLANHYTIEIVTHRAADERAATVEWLEACDIPYDALHLPAPDNKAETGIDILIEDYPPNARAARDAGCEDAYVIIRTSNLQHFPVEGLTSAADLASTTPETFVGDSQTQWTLITDDLLSRHT